MLDYIILTASIAAAVLSLISILKISEIAKKKNSSGEESLFDILQKVNASERDIFVRLQQQVYEALKDNVRQSAEAVRESVKQAVEAESKKISELENRITSFMAQIDSKQELLRSVTENNLQRIIVNNNEKLEAMRRTVDEKLNENLDKKLNESFSVISERLEAVSKGLGEMQNLAAGVGDLKKVLTNVKTRGTWGEVQLHNLLEQMLSPEQFVINPNIGDELDRVEFAIKLPGKTGNDSVLLPIDSKFPVSDYERLIEASENGDKESADAASKQLERRIREEAKKINLKYVIPPRTTDFAIMYLPIEGLFAEVLRKPGVCEQLQNEYRVIICGPTTLTALLNSLQVGFKTLAIEKNSSEVAKLLSSFKTQFDKFKAVLSKAQKKLQETTNTISQMETRTNVIGKQLDKSTRLLSGASESLILEEEIFEGTAASEDETYEN